MTYRQLICSIIPTALYEKVCSSIRNREKKEKWADFRFFIYKVHDEFDRNWYPVFFCHGFYCLEDESNRDEDGHN